MMSADLLISARRVVTPEGIRPATVAIAGGMVSDILPRTDATMPAEAVMVELADDEVLLPGLVDTHVHVNEPGRTDWEGFASATRAAAAGGVTTIIDMPLNSLPPTTDVAALQLKRAAAQPRCHVDVGFWAGAVPGNTAAREPLHRAGVFGFKCFTVDSGVPEFPPVDAAGLAQAAADVARLGSRLLVHAEDAAHVEPARGRDYAAFLRSRPEEAETAAIGRLVEVARRTGARVHVLHLSASAALPIIAAARQQGLPVTAETCPHYLALAAQDIPAGATEFKCCPPIRSRANRELLWDGLRAGIIECVVSDHSPCPPALKRQGHGDFSAAWGGISSLQLSLSAVWTHARARGCTLADVAGWMSAGPARLAGLAAKGAIAPGKDADLIVLAPDEEFTVDPGTLHHRHPVTPYKGQRLAGVVRRAWLRGRPLTGEQPAGRLLRPTGGDHG